jgi:hypothetical protein
MNNSKVSKFIGSVRTAASKHSPEILTGIGIAGMITTTILAVKATPKALRLIEEKKEKERVDKLSPLEIVKTTWKCYIPAVALGVTSTACLIGASSVSVRRNAALATAYKLSETALTEYREKVIETIGEKKERTVRDAIAKDKLEHDPVSNKEVIITGKGNTRCYETVSGRYFTSDIDKLNKIVNELNRRMLNEGYISLNEFYSEIGLPPLPLGDELGWRTDRGLLDLYFSSQLDDTGTPCLVVGFDVTPKRDYSSAF